MSTEKPSPALKNTSLCKAHAQGLWAEAQVVSFLQKKSFRILKCRWRTPFAEIDILAESPAGEVWIFEVKSLRHFDFLDVRLGRKQKERLHRAHLFIQSKTPKPVRLALIFVDAQAKMMVFEDF